MVLFKWAIGIFVMMCSPAVALTQTPSATPTATPCTTIGPPTLSATLTGVQPALPGVGDQVVLTFQASARGGLPTYSVFGFTPVLQGNPPSVHHTMFSMPAQFDLTAAQAGTAMVNLSVNFETATGCAENPIFHFVTLTAGPFAVGVVSPTPSATATPTATPMQSPTPPDDDGCAVIPPGSARDGTLLLLSLPAWILRRRGRKSGSGPSRGREGPP